MFRIAIALLLVAAPLAGQTASVTHYGTGCPIASGRPLTTQGLPRLGTTLTVTGIVPALTCSPSNPLVCIGPPFVVFSFFRGNGTVVWPGLIGHNCPIQARPDEVLFGDAIGEVGLQVPNRTHLLGLRFYLQSVTPNWFVNPSLPHLGVFTGVTLSDGVECVIGT